MAGQSSQAPRRAEDGSFLHAASVTGRKVDFILPTQSSSSVSFALPAGTSTSLGLNAVLYDPLLPTAQRTSQNIITPSNCIVWWYVDFWVDTDNDFNYELAIGTSLSAEQQLVYIRTQWDELTPVTGSSQRRIYQFVNGGASSHTIYLRAQARYIILS